MPSALGWKGDAALVAYTNLANAVQTPAFKAAAATTASFVSFASVVLPICAVTSTITGIYAQAKLLELGQEITDNLKKLTESAQVANSLQYQAHFGQHVHDFVASRIRACKKSDADGKDSSTTDYFFVYHPRTDWHASFERHIEEKPLPNLLGWTHNLELIAHFVSQIRATIGPEATVHILMPSAHMYIVPEEFTLDQSLFPLVFEGELADSSEPYVYLNMPELDASSFHQIGRLPQCKKTESKAPTNETVRTLLSTSAAVPAGIVGGLGGTALGLVGLSVFCPFAGVPLIVGGLLAPGAVLGTASAMGAGVGVEKVYDHFHEKKTKN
ncbi:uncharacterized protein LY89DRAFT_124934 [Mollisia scopiformis]|uniref:Uncharacterized protein n=1 Tax=Mollisia scopiformis TaxID=149040 RepID=A0A194X429_MOLSC|nr:uncharacterized protein LY89DRAFT_124934 [Mollisia scopiformis]KUJ14921.1 hypothetical protein LY89DRAFT_124934 [Mollisia scopiformis]